MNPTHELDRQTVSALAHRLWEARGKEEGHALDDWLAAERQLRGEQTADSKPGDEAQSAPAKKRGRGERRAKAAKSGQPEIPKLGSSDAPGG